MFFTKGFGRDVVSVIAIHVGRNVWTLAAMRRVSKQWKEGCERRWESVKAECFLSPEVSVFWTNKPAVFNSLVHVFENDTSKALAIMIAYFECNLVPDSETIGQVYKFVSRSILYRITFNGASYEIYSMSSLIPSNSIPALLKTITVLDFIKPYKSLFS